MRKNRTGDKESYPPIAIHQLRMKRHSKLQAPLKNQEVIAQHCTRIPRLASYRVLFSTCSCMAYVQLYIPISQDGPRMSFKMRLRFDISFECRFGCFERFEHFEHFEGPDGPILLVPPWS